LCGVKGVEELGSNNGRKIRRSRVEGLGSSV